MIDFENSILYYRPWLLLQSIRVIVPISCRSVISPDSCYLMNLVTKKVLKNIVDAVTLFGD